GQRLQRRHVQNASSGARGSWFAFGESVDRPQERGKRLTGPGRRDDQRVVAVGDGRPRLGLGVRGRRERPCEALAGQRAEPAESIGGGAHLVIVPTATDKLSADRSHRLATSDQRDCWRSDGRGGYRRRATSIMSGSSGRDTPRFLTAKLNFSLERW